MTTRIGKHQRHGLTIVELLVAIAVLAALFAILLPAIGSARSAVDRMRCANHLKQITLAYENYRNDFDSGPDTFGPAYFLSPYLESNLGIRDRIENFGHEARVESPEVWLCPLEPVDRTLGAYSYLPNGNLGIYDHTAPGSVGFIVGGTGFPYLLTPEEMQDGPSSTVLFSEKVLSNWNLDPDRDWQPFPSLPPNAHQGSPLRTTWNTSPAVRANLSPGDLETLSEHCANQRTGFSPGTDGMRRRNLMPNDRFTTYFTAINTPNTPSCLSGVLEPAGSIASHASAYGSYAASSHHPGGVNASFADGSVRFVSEEIELTTWRALCSAQGNDLVKMF